MSNPTNIPPIAPPSARRLLRSIAIAVAVAAVILVTVVLPAEYGIDPTGVGRVLGLKQMGEIKMELAIEAAEHAAAQAAADSAFAERVRGAPPDTARRDTTTEDRSPKSK